MPSIRQRVYTYLLLVAVPILSILFINKSMTYLCRNAQDFRKMPIGTQLRLVCDLDTNQEYIKLPNIEWFDGVDKFNTLLGMTYDHWSIHTFEAKIKVAKYPDRTLVNKNEYLVIGGHIQTDIDKDGKISYTIPISEPQELSEIIISNYIDHHAGFIGKISYIFTTIYPPGLTIKEFNRVMVCIDQIVYPKGEKHHDRRH
jgi:hypothetical protein